MVLIPLSMGQGNRLSIQSSTPANLSVCGINDSAVVQVYNISSGTVTGIILRLNLAPGIKYVRNSVRWGGITESNVSNLNQPEFSAPNLAIAKNFRFRVMLTADCDLLPYLNANNTPVIQVRATYTGNFDVGSSIPFQVRVPSVQFGTITNLSYTGDIGSRFARSVTIGNYGKGPLREVRLKRINGKDLKTFYVSQGNTVYSGDTVTTIFNAAYFKGIGNLDTFLDQNETITFLDSSVINACRFLNTTFELSWGCNGKSCQVSKTTGSALISNRTPFLKALPFPVTPTCFNKNVFKSEIRFVNTGNMPALQPRISISLNYPYVLSTFDTSSVRIKIGHKGTWSKVAKDSTTGSYNLGYYGCIGLYPIGLFRIKSPDLKPNDTLYVSWNTESCTTPPCSNAPMLMNSWAFHADYRDQCKNLKSIPWTWGKVYDQHYFNSTSFIPTDLINNQTGEFRTLISSASLLPRTTAASYVVDLILPKGLVHSKLKKDLYFINADLNANWNPDSIVQKGDTLRGYFPHPVPISLTNAELVYYLKADCSKAGANGTQTIKLQIRYLADKNCNPREWLYLTCQTMQLKIHCVSNCNGGMRFRNFSVRRISFGLPDNNNDGVPDNTGTLDTLRIREERCFTGDTILAEFTGTVKRTSTIITWRNAYIETTITNGKPLDIAGIQLLVWRRGVVQSVNCTQIRSWKTVTGNNASFKIDLSTDSMQACVSSGFRYSTDDSLIVKVKFRVSDNIGGVVQNIIFNNRFYTSNVNNPTSNANKFQCDTFSGQMIMTGYYFATCCNDVLQLNSCNQIAVSNNFYLGIGPCCSNYGGNNYFPFEYRSFARIKSIRYYLPTGFRMKNARFTQVRTAGSNRTASEFKDSLNAGGGSTSTLVYEVTPFYKDSAGGKIQRSDDAFHGTFTAWMEPSCEIQQAGNIPVKYDFIFERLNTLGGGYDTVRSGTADQIVYNKPVSTVRPTSPVIYAAQDTAEWEIVYTNYSPTFSNVNAWFAPDNSGAIKVVQIRDASADTLLPSSGLVFRAGNIPFNQTRKFKVRAVYNSCNKDSIILYTGWNCAGYPKDLASYNCLKERIPLYLEPQNTQYQSTLTDSVSITDLCTNTPYTLTIENTGSTTGYNTRAFVHLPIGMSVVPGSCYMRYPAGSGKTAIPLPTLKSGTTYEWNLSSLSTAVGNGFKGVGDITKNKIIIYFRVKTDCDYSSGNFIRAGGTGNIKCGDPVQSYTSISNTLNIKGVTRPYYTLLKTEADSVFPCEKPSSVRVKIINLGPAMTGIEDKYQVVLLPGMVYDSSMFSGLYNYPDNSLTRTRNINGATEVEFSLPDSIAPGDSMAFSFGFVSEGRRLNCGTTDLYSQAAVKQEVLCVSNQTKCKINVVTGNNLLKTPVIKGLLSFNSPSALIRSTGSDSEQLTLSYKILNSGNLITRSKPIIMRYLYDANASGTADVTDPEVMRDTLYMDLGSREDTTLTRDLRVKAGVSCALFLALDSASCSCNFASVRFPVPALRNAGPDRSVCSGDTVGIGTSAVGAFSYLWTPGNELNSDTLSGPSARIINDDSGMLSRQFVLTTYRGQCISRDTVLVRVYKLPELRLSLRDTNICRGQKASLKAFASGGTGRYGFLWSPAAGLSDRNISNPVASPSATVTYRLTVTDSASCKASDSVHIEVRSVPVARFVFSETCQGDALILRDSSSVSSDSITYLRWTGEGLDTLHVKSIAPQLGPSLQGNMQLVASTSSGCSDTFRSALHLNPLPVSGFTALPVCFGDTVIGRQYSSVSRGSIVFSEWQSGDGNLYSDTVMRHRYAAADTFDATLVNTTDMGCRDTFTSKVFVYPLPTAEFSVAGVCLGDSSRTVNLSRILRDSIITYRWITAYDTQYLTSPTYLFGSDTLQRIELQAESANGCRDTFALFAEIYSNPIAGFSTVPVCEKDSTPVYSASGIRHGNITDWQYVLSDGSSYAVPDFKHRFATGDTFGITLTVTSDHSCRDTVSKEVIVYPKLIPDFQFRDICISDTLHISDRTAFVNTSVASWFYDFGSQGSSANQDPSATFRSWGTHAIRLRVTSTEGCAYDTVRYVKVYPLPEVYFTDSNKCVDNRFDFRSNVTVDTGYIAALSWSFGDDSTSVLPDPFHSFPGAGVYTVRLRAVSDFGCMDSFERNVVSYPKVIVTFSAENVCLGDPTVFVNNSIAPNSSILSQTWDFGDGDTSHAVNPLHTYTVPDTFRVSLSVNSAYNCRYDTTGTAVVYPVPAAMFSNHPDEGTIVNPEIRITDLSSGADSIYYDLGDGKTSTLRNLVNEYPDSGTFIIRQYAGNTYGCRDTFSKEIRIRYMFVFNAPTAFSPNEDGVNDLYAPGGIGIRNYSMDIYNRWGELIYSTEDGKPWDGTYRGMPVMEGVYAVTFKVRDFKGVAHWYSTSLVLMR